MLIWGDTLYHVTGVREQRWIMGQMEITCDDHAGAAIYHNKSTPAHLHACTAMRNVLTGGGPEHSLIKSRTVTQSARPCSQFTGNITGGGQGHGPGRAAPSVHCTASLNITFFTWCFSSTTWRLHQSLSLYLSIGGRGEGPCQYFWVCQSSSPRRRSATVNKTCHKPDALRQIHNGSGNS